MSAVVSLGFGELPVFATVKDERGAIGMAATRNFTNDDNVVAGIVCGLQRAFECSEGSIDQRHSAMGFLPAATIKGCFRFCKRCADIALIGRQNMNRKSARSNKVFKPLRRFGG